jgi:hypothetical protein
MAAIASYRRYDKYNPKYYAELTVRKAAEALRAVTPVDQLSVSRLNPTTSSDRLPDQTLNFDRSQRDLNR